MNRKKPTENTIDYPRYQIDTSYRPPKNLAKSITAIATSEFTDTADNQDRAARCLSMAIPDYVVDVVWTSIYARDALCTMIDIRNNNELYNSIHMLNSETRSCIRSEWDIIRWNNTYNRCRKCFVPSNAGDCEECFIPTCVYHLTDEQWKRKRCMICHAGKKYINAILCGGILCMLRFVLITRPGKFPILGTTDNNRQYIKSYLTIIWK